QKKIIDKSDKSVEAETGFEEGEKVLLFNINKTKKSSPTNVGPFIVEEKTSPFYYRVKSVNGGDSMKVHVSRMRKFVSSSSKEEELASAMNDDREYRVEKGICHRGKGKRNIKFRVKWEGFPMEDNTWETFNDVKETSAFWDYV
ncbi:hypothetical protein ADUPG1_001319, partial [Aduncisulcus paluster]